MTPQAAGLGRQQAQRSCPRSHAPQLSPGPGDQPGPRPTLGSGGRIAAFEAAGREEGCGTIKRRDRPPRSALPGSSTALRTRAARLGSARSDGDILEISQSPPVSPMPTAPSPAARPRAVSLASRRAIPTLRRTGRTADRARSAVAAQLRRTAYRHASNSARVFASVIFTGLPPVEG